MTNVRALAGATGLAIIAAAAGCAETQQSRSNTADGSPSAPTSAPARHAALFQRLESTDAKTRKAAVEEAGRIGAPLVPDLLPRLTGYDSRTAYAAAVSLGAIRDRRAVEPMIWALRNSRSFGVRYAAIWGLGRFGDRRAVPVLMHFATTGRNEMMRGRALTSLQKVDEGAAVDALVRTVNDRLPNLSWKAYYRIGAIRDRRAVPALIRALDHPMFAVRHNAESALAEIGDSRAVMPLVRILQDRTRQRATFQIYEEREWVASVLGYLGDRKAVPFLIGALNDPDAKVRQRAAEALGRLGDDRAVPRLVAAVDGGNRKVRRAAESALGKIGGARAEDILLRRLQEPGGDSVRRIRNVGNTGTWRALGPLMAFLAHGDEQVRTATANAITKLDLKPLLAPVLKAAQSGDEAAIKAAFSTAQQSGFGDLLELYALLDGPDSPARKVAGEALARAGAFRVLDTPPIPAEARTHFAKGVAEFRKASANYTTCAYHFGRAAALAPWWPELRYNMALMEERWSSPSSAIEEYETYLALAPSAGNASTVRARIQELRRPKKPARGDMVDFTDAKNMMEAIPPRSKRPHIEKPLLPPPPAPDRRGY